MRPFLAAALALVAAACRSGSLGQCSSDSDCPAGAVCDQSAKVCAVREGACFPACGEGLSCRSAACVDVTPPTIGDITVTTAPDFAPGIYRGEDGGTLSVSARITDVSGVRNACLQVEGETGCPHAGNSVDGGLWTFTLPRAPTVGTLDGTPVSFTVSADDAPDGGSPNHGTATAFVRFDNSGPAIRIAADPQPYARLLPDGGPDIIRVEAVITDATGVCQAGGCGPGPKITVGTSPPALPVAQDGGSFFFDLDATKAPSGAEGALEFTVAAQDTLGHLASAEGSRLVDDKPPAVTLKVFRDGDPEPASDAGFPPAAPNTGYDGLTFIYSDLVHVKGTVTDQGGIGAVAWRIDGVGVDGGVSTGTANPICDGGTSCSFDVLVALNAPGNGELHTTSADLESRNNLSATNGPTSIPVANLHVVVSAADRTQTAAHEAVAKQTLRSVAAKTTRFLWLANLPDFRFVNGLAIHPNGDLVATTESTGSATDEVFALPTSARPLADGGFPLHWSFGQDAGFGAGGLGDIVDMPAIGDGDASTAVVYVATTDGGVFALRPDGSRAWRATGLQQLRTAPTVVAANGSESVVIPSVAPGAANASVFTVRSDGAGGAVVLDAGTVDDDFNSAPLAFDGGVYFGTSRNLFRLEVSDGGLSTPADAGGEIWSPVTDGVSIYTATLGGLTSALNTFQPSLSRVRGTTVVGGVNQDLIVDMNSRVIGSTTDQRLVSIDTTTGDLAPLGTLEPVVNNTSNGKIPLQGSDGTLYLPQEGHLLLAFTTSHATSWTFGTNAPIFRAVAMDCAGRLFVASDETIYALVTDDRGLADAPWPTYRRDSRATGNFGAPKYGMRLPGPDGGVCNN